MITAITAVLVCGALLQPSFFGIHSSAAVGTGTSNGTGAVKGFSTADGTGTADESLSEAAYCSFVIPPEFVPSDEDGLFINKNYPMESSSVSYSFYDNGKKTLLTNREKQELKESGEAVTVDERTALSKEIYEETVSAAYNEEYGEDVGYKVESFKNITVDGFPGYEIVASYQAADEEVIHQRVYMILSRYRTFTITLQRAEDDDCEEIFSEIAATIHVG